jgi:hypothetical protein
MIQLHQDYLLFQTTSGDSIPCSVELVAIELVGDAATTLNPELLREAAAAVLHYFKHDLGRSSVSVADFAAVLERVLKTFGLDVKPSAEANLQTGGVFDLRQLTGESDEAFELAFFTQLRDELRKRLTESPRMLQVRGLRACVKRLLGAKRWSYRCQVLNDQIVDYLRRCLSTEESAASCGLVVR